MAEMLGRRHAHRDPIANYLRMSKRQRALYLFALPGPIRAMMIQKILLYKRQHRRTAGGRHVAFNPSLSMHGYERQLYGYDGLLMGFKWPHMKWNPKTKMGKEIKRLITEFKNMTHEQRRAAFRRLPAWKKLLIIAAAPALFSAATVFAASTLPALAAVGTTTAAAALAVAIPTAIPVASTWLTAKGAKMLSKKIIQSVQAARAARLANPASMTAQEHAAAEKTEAAVIASAQTAPSTAGTAEPKKPAGVAALAIPAAALAALALL